MINLIPPSARKKVQLEYWIRVCTVWIMLLAVAAVIIGLFLIPIHVLIQAQLASYTDSFTAANDQNNSYAVLEQKIEQGSQIATRIQQDRGAIMFTQYIDEIEHIAGVSISLHTITMQRDTTGRVQEISIQGEATSRAVLAAFRDKLEESDFFTSAILPIANLAKDREIPFSITIVTSNGPIQ